MLFLQQGIVSGLVTGSVYALLAIAVVVIFKTTEVPNFAQGEIFMAGGYLSLYFLVVLSMPALAANPLALELVGIGGAVFQRGVLRPGEKGPRVAGNPAIPAPW